jgi:hypothetical protein
MACPPSAAAVRGWVGQAGWVDVGVFEGERRRLFGVAYRMLGSAVEAEDVVQDAFLRWQGADRAAIAVPRAWLVTVVRRLCLNRLGEARVRRERYVGEWLPEPVLTGDGALGPLDSAERRDSVSVGRLGDRRRFAPAAGDWRRLVERFVAAARDGDLTGLETLLAADVVAVSDGGGLARRRRDRDAVDRVEPGQAGLPGAAGGGLSRRTALSGPHG